MRTEQTAPTWDKLLAIAPDLKAFELDAEQAGRNGCRSWLGWVRTFGLFVALLKPLEQWHPGAKAVVMDHLAATYGRAAAEAAARRIAANTRRASG